MTFINDFVLFEKHQFIIVFGNSLVLTFKVFLSKQKLLEGVWMTGFKIMRNFKF